LPTNLLQAFHPRDAGNNRTKDNHRDDHGDQADEGIAERLHGDCFSWAKVPNGDGNGDRRQHLERQARVERLFRLVRIRPRANRQLNGCGNLHAQVSFPSCALLQFPRSKPASLKIADEKAN